jgi:hypothetical protein
MDTICEKLPKIPFFLPNFQNLTPFALASVNLQSFSEKAEKYGRWIGRTDWEAVGASGVS